MKFRLLAKKQDDTEKVAYGDSTKMKKEFEGADLKCIEVKATIKNIDDLRDITEILRYLGPCFINQTEEE